MTDPTRNARQQRWRDRKAGKLPPVERLECISCGRIHTGARGQHCSRCWESQTLEGRAFRNARVRKSRQARRNVSECDAGAPTPEA